MEYFINNLQTKNIKRRFESTSDSLEVALSCRIHFESRPEMKDSFPFLSPAFLLAFLLAFFFAFFLSFDKEL